MTEARKLAAILVTDIVGFSRLAGADEERILARLRALRSDLIDPTISVYRGRVVKRTGDGAIVEFRSVVDAVRCGIELQQGLVERNAGLPPERRIEFRVGIHLGDVVEESDGDLMGDGVNIAARLEGIARPGAICLSEDAYRQVKGRLDLMVSDLGQTELKNIAEPIRVYSLEVGAGARTATASGAAGGSAGPAPEKSPPPRLSMVVLPFANLGGAPEQEHFVDGVTESLTTDLSRIANAFVVARNTAFTYKGKPVDAKQIGRELNVRYILEGSIQHGGSRLRVNVQLIDATTGNHLWADRFDKPLGDPFDMQDEIVSYLANLLRPELLAAEARRAENEANPDSIDLYFQGVQWFNKGGIQNIERARGYFERAVALDPTNIDALVGAARADVLIGGIYENEERGERLAAAEALLIKGISIAPRNYWAHLWLGFVEILTNRASQGIGELERALALNRNLGAAHAWIGLAKITMGRPEETEAHVKEALRLSPADAVVFIWHHILGVAKMNLGADEEAAALFRRSIDASRNYPLNHFYGAAALARLGRLDEARAEVKAGLALAPRYSIARFRRAAESDNPTYLAGRERIEEGMRKAGVPEE
jgi:TolB-like protein/class 3 adenylate cyclase